MYQQTGTLSTLQLKLPAFPRQGIRSSQKKIANILENVFNLRMDEYQKKKHSAAVLPAECFFFLVMYDHETAVTPGFAQDAAMREILDSLSIAYSFCFTTSSLISSSRVLCIDPIYTLA